ncbi:MAG: NADH-quinone oxidoreductase subunit L [Candidatus Omnitrophica bacterium]|nr:NADH-quinone oxidoreductase subunit L [Candidatus Omnitrophota bacterium]
MAQQLLTFLILFPLAVAVIVAANRKNALFPYIVHPASVVLIAASCGLLALHAGGAPSFIPAHFGWVEPVMLVAECAIAAYLLWLAAKQRDMWVGAFLVLQTVTLLWFHFGPGHQAHAEFNLFVDLFSVIMGLIVGVIGTLIAVFAVGYMNDFHHHHHEVPDRRPLFFGLIFLFLSAMFGICFSNNLMWLFFFWEVTTVCSFLLIRYKGDEQSVKNAFWALRWNLLGGLAFLLGIVYLYNSVKTIELNQMLLMPKMLVLVPVALISFAGMTKSAQLPFSSWLVGAMVAPTPVSALLHSSTMVKAGVYIVLRFASTLEGTALGFVVAMVGIITFLVGSFICISQNDAKKVLAYSTIANLGLIILCAGMGTYEAVWAGILLIIFHAISKGLLFLCVGTIEHATGSRQIGDMEGLVHRMPALAAMLRVGIAGMFLAPFGMLISKWAVLRAIVDYNPLVAIFLIYGSSATLFFWVKWIGKVIVVNKEYENVEGQVSRDQWIPLWTLTALTVLICAFFAPVAQHMIEPYIQALYAHTVSLGAGNIVIMGLMLGMVGMFPVAFLVERSHGRRLAKPYLAGANTGAAGQQFIGSLGGAREATMSNYYMEDYFPEARLMRLGVMISIMLVVLMFVVGGL